jgi:D-alanyl-D-alanine carboxypeptidase/D-alanyl-D-alanine-endopeptidase (penicillin-binding protein 4)
MLLRIAAIALVAALAAPAPAGAQWTGADAAALAADLDHLVASAKTLHAAHVGALVVPVDGGKPLYERRADAVVQPASTMKLIVGSAALDRLGPDYRFTTTLGRAPLATGDGDALVLHGGGDPLLRRADLDAAADAVRAAGITRAQVTVDESHVVPDERRAPGWSVDDILQDYAPVVNGLPFEENVLALTLLPGANVDQVPTMVLPAPFQPSVNYGVCRPGPTLLTFSINARTVPAGRPDTTDVTTGPCSDVVIFGDVPIGGPSHVDAAVDQPEALALAYFADALRKRGVEVLPPPLLFVPIAGVVGAPFTPVAPGTIVWRHDGEPLSKLLADMWLPSDNLIAEELLREIDVAAGGHAGSIAGGAALERTWLKALGADPATVTIADGSGLSQYNRITPRVLVSVLLHDWHGPRRDLVLAALPVAGVRGDLRNAMRGTPAEGHVFAKTGSMQHVRGLAGFVTTRTHGTVAFALSIDDWIGTDAEMAAFRAAFCARLAVA